MSAHAYKPTPCTQGYRVPTLAPTATYIHPLSADTVGMLDCGVYYMEGKERGLLLLCESNILGKEMSEYVCVTTESRAKGKWNGDRLFVDFLSLFLLQTQEHIIRLSGFILDNLRDSREIQEFKRDYKNIFAGKSSKCNLVLTKNNACNI